MTAEGTVGAPTCYLINHIPGNPGPISRKSGNGKIVGIPENRTREIPGMKHYAWGGMASWVRLARAWPDDIIDLSLFLSLCCI
jgi:hypothetical protein